MKVTILIETESLIKTSELTSWSRLSIGRKTNIVKSFSWSINNDSLLSRQKFLTLQESLDMLREFRHFQNFESLC